jgi:outer membrane protein assembly factor BamB
VDGNDLLLLEERTGKEKWSYSFKSNKGIEIWYDDSMLIVTWKNDSLFVSEVVAISVESGNVLWRLEDQEKEQLAYKNFEVFGNIVMSESWIPTTFNFG